MEVRIFRVRSSIEGAPFLFSKELLLAMGNICFRAKRFFGASPYCICFRKMACSLADYCNMRWRERYILKAGGYVAYDLKL